MKKLIVITVVTVFGLFMLSSCNIEEIKEKYGYTENQTKIHNDEVGDDPVDDQDEFEELYK